MDSLAVDNQSPGKVLWNVLFVLQVFGVVLNSRSFGSREFERSLCYVRAVGTESSRMCSVMMLVGIDGTWYTMSYLKSQGYCETFGCGHGSEVSKSPLSTSKMVFEPAGLASCLAHLIVLDDLTDGFDWLTNSYEPSVYHAKGMYTATNGWSQEQGWYLQLFEHDEQAPAVASRLQPILRKEPRTIVGPRYSNALGMRLFNGLSA